MVKAVFNLNITENLKNYLDNLNHGICITNTNKSIYNNKSNENCEISNELKEMLYTLYNDKELNLFLNSHDNEKRNLELSNNYINDINIEDEFLNKFVNKLVYTREKKIQLLKYDNFKYYFFKCIIPIQTNYFRGSLLVCSMDPDDSIENKKGFLRFCIGQYYIVKHYIENVDCN